MNNFFFNIKQLCLAYEIIAVIIYYSMQIYINFDRYEIEGYMYLKNRSAIESSKYHSSNAKIVKISYILAVYTLRVELM